MANIDKAPMGVNIRRQYKDEARFLRAWYYYILLRHYGGIPIIGDTCYKANDKVKATRDTYETCVNYVVNECKAILDDGALLPRFRTEQRQNKCRSLPCPDNARLS